MQNVIESILFFQNMRANGCSGETSIATRQLMRFYVRLKRLLTTGFRE
jgi:hypothetical protein